MSKAMLTSEEAGHVAEDLGHVEAGLRYAESALDLGDRALVVRGCLDVLSATTILLNTLLRGDE
jgi:hypothetical protein